MGSKKDGDGKAVRVLCAEMGEWGDYGPSGRSAAGLESASREPQPFGDFLRSFLLTENLVVLAGLGASRCVTAEGGKKLCPTMRELWTEAKTQAGDGFPGILAAVQYDTGKDGENIEALLSRCQMVNAVHADAEVSTFTEKAEELIVRRCRFPEHGVPLQVHEALLRRVARGSTRRARLKVFTTNYDLCFEVAANNARFILVDGFSHLQPQEFDGALFGYDFVRREESEETPNYLPNVFHLYKLHGSVDWEAVDRGRVVRNAQAKHPLIVYPRYSKFESSYTPPFVELMSRFQMVLRQHNVALLVIGSGLGDGHLKGPIEAAIRANVGLRVMLVSPGLEESPHDVAKEMAELMKLGDRRLALCACGFEDFVPLLPDVAAETEAERHEERFRKVSR